MSGDSSAHVPIPDSGPPLDSLATRINGVLDGFAKERTVTTENGVGGSARGVVSSAG